jgi:chromosome segregation ATPase
MNKTSKIILGVSIALILILGAFIYMQFSKISEAENQLVELTQVMEFEKQQSIEEYEKLAMEYEEFYIETSNDSLLKLFDEEKQKVQQLLQELKTVKATNARRIKELQKELGTVRGVLKSYIYKVDSLNTVNDNLKKENVKVKKQIAEAQEIKRQLEEKTNELDAKINLASILEADNIQIKTLNKKGKATKSLKRITNIEICFQVLRNITAERGYKTVYIRIADANGEVLTTETKTFEFEGKQLIYSAKKEIEYNGEDTPVCMYYKVTNPLQTGTYSIAIFAEGNLIGTTGIVLK